MAAMLVAALRRFVTLLSAVGAVTLLISLGFGALAGTPVLRSISLGFYLVGSFLLIAGFFIGNRGPVRLKREEATAFMGTRVLRWATPAEREDTINTSAIFVVLGLVLIIFGVVADDRHKLV
jgi:hypothetical protein